MSHACVVAEHDHDITMNSVAPVL